MCECVCVRVFLVSIAAIATGYSPSFGVHRPSFGTHREPYAIALLIFFTNRICVLITRPGVSKLCRASVNEYRQPPPGLLPLVSAIDLRVWVYSAKERSIGGGDAEDNDWGVNLLYSQMSLDYLRRHFYCITYFYILSAFWLYFLFVLYNKYNSITISTITVQ